jgi:DNA-binding NarL/FixJ family response regulator
MTRGVVSGHLTPAERVVQPAGQRCGPVFCRPAPDGRAVRKSVVRQRLGRASAGGTMGGPVQVLIVDEHGIVREGVRLLLGREDAIAVAGDAADGAGALRLAARLAAGDGLDLVLTELALPDMGGQELAGRLKAAHPGIRVLFLSTLSDDAPIADLLEGGGDGYILKQAAGQDLARAVRAVTAGETYLSPAVARRFVQQVRRGRARVRLADQLSAREREVLGLLAGGGTSKEAARALGLRPKTVENHRASILGKLGVANTAAAIRVAYEEGLLASRRDGAA